MTHLRAINQRLDRLESRLDQIQSGTDNMSQHINFVERVYDNVRTPFHTLMGLVPSVPKLGWDADSLQKLDDIHTYFQDDESGSEK